MSHPATHRLLEVCQQHNIPVDSRTEIWTSVAIILTWLIEQVGFIRQDVKILKAAHPKLRF